MWFLALTCRLFVCFHAFFFFGLRAQHAFSDKVREVLRQHLKESRFDSESVDVGITVPLSWLVRERLINIHLRNL